MRIIKIVALFLLYVLLFFAMGEIWVRLACKHKAINEMDIRKYRTASEIYHHAFIPNGKGRLYTSEFKTVYLINSFGIRDREYSLKKPPRTYRILILGDSFTEGYGMDIEHTFSKRLEEFLNTKPPNEGMKYEVINFGCAGYCPMLEYLLLKEKGLLLDPDLVILLLDLSDFHDDIRFTKSAQFDKDGRPIAVPSGGPSIAETTLKEMRFDYFLLRHSVFYTYLRLRIKKTLSPDTKEELKIKFGDPMTDKFWMFRDQIYLYDDKGEEHSIVENTESNRLQVMRFTFSYLSMINSLLKQHGSEFILVFFPYGQQIGADEWSVGREFYGFEKGETYSDFKFYETTLRKDLDKDSISSISLYESLKNATLKPLFFEIDGHFNANGHEVVASALYEYLRNKLSKE